MTDDSDKPKEPPTQASKLPRKLDFTLDPMKPLKGMPDYDIWLFKVESTLQQHNLHNLINSSIARPSPSDPRYEHWQKFSKFIKTWLTRQLGKPIIRAILCTEERFEFADEFMDIIEQLVLGDPKLAWSKAANMKREEYESLDHFVSVLKMRVRYSNKVDKRIAPAFATEILFAEAREEAKGYVDVMASRLTAAKKRSMTWDTFYDYCAEVSSYFYEHSSDEEDTESDESDEYMDGAYTPMDDDDDDY